MSDDEQRTEKAKLLLEWTENKQELERRRAVALRIADVLQAVAEQLHARPESLIFPGEKASLRAIDKQISVSDVSGLDVAAIQKVRDAIRELEDRQEKLRPRMTAFNLPI